MMTENELASLFAASRREEDWPETPDLPSAVWWRARADELLEEALLRPEARPLAWGRRVAGLATLLAVEWGLFEAFHAIPADRLGVPPLTAALLAIVAAPALALLHHLRRETAAG
jgi:hypothetical protein